MPINVYLLFSGRQSGADDVNVDGATSLHTGT